MPLNTLLQNYPELEVCRQSIEDAVKLIGDAYETGNTLFTCGNGGSCADADHISGEFLKGFCKKRPVTDEIAAALQRSGSPEDGAMLASKLQRGLRCIPLAGFSAALSAVRNDLDGQMDFSQVLFALGKPGDILLGISTSGNSRNVRLAVVVAKAIGMKVIGMTGERGGILAQMADVVIKAPSAETFRIQEYHLPVYHAICRMVEERFF